MLVSGVQQSDSVIHIHVPILFQILFPVRLLESIDFPGGPVVRTGHFHSRGPSSIPGPRRGN